MAEYGSGRCGVNRIRSAFVAKSQAVNGLNSDFAEIHCEIPKAEEASSWWRRETG